MVVERPEPEPTRLLAAIDEWAAGAATPGTAMQALKRGGLDLLIERVDNAELASVWDAWERGKAMPLDTLQRLDHGGVRALLGDAEQAEQAEQQQQQQP